MKKIHISDVAKKHLKIVGYLTVSGALAYLLSLVTGREESVYLTPVINYILYSVKQELSKEGVIQAIKSAK